MGTLRNPIGPLPSSIYWRRRAVALFLAVVLLVLAIWAISSGGGDGDGAGDGKANGASSSAPSTITPGPSRSGTAISEQPGGRENPGGSGGSGGSGGGGTGGSTGSGGSGSGGSGSGGSGSGGSGSGSGGGAPEGQRAGSGSVLPDCPSGALELALDTRNDYEPDEKPSFRMRATNTSSTHCKADFGPKAAVLTIQNDSAEVVWSSKDCPRPGQDLVLNVPAKSAISHTVEWDRTRSEPKCATPSAGRVPAGTYLVELRFPGEPVKPQSFVLKKS
ncbi:hypothetical protein [Streptomyces jumonjinensis]|uniref:hypothetical protein n=1 Tax=Streptomyces jumonjinensis TaxID=1945 RepID=UPI003798C511